MRSTFITRFHLAGKKSESRTKSMDSERNSDNSYKYEKNTTPLGKLLAY